MFYTYILQSSTWSKYYIGSCENIKKRLVQHNKGRVKSTKRFIPWKIVHKETFKTRKVAMARERQLKSWESRDALEKLILKHL